MIYRFLLSLGTILLLSASVNTSHHRHKWQNVAWLGDPGQSPRLYWLSEHTKVTFRVEANTIGAIRIGFEDHDVAILWVDDSTRQPHLQDYHYGNESSKLPLLDSIDNLNLISGEQNLTHTSIIFSRPWNTCDDEDVILGKDTIHMTWSMHPHDPADTEYYSEIDPIALEAQELHEAVKGEKTLLLQVPSEPVISKSSNVHQWDLLMRNVIIRDDMSTQYWCKVFASPPMAKKNHIIAYEPFLLSPTVNLVQRLILYECSAPTGFLDSYANQHPGVPCYSPEMPQDWETCLTPVAVWVAGGGAKIFPDHIGIPIGHRPTYFMLEIHYNNPGRRKGLDNSGFRLYHTEELRQFDAGVMMTGVTAFPLHLIPPTQSNYLSAGLCNDVCTSKMLPEMGIKVSSVLLHSHLAGRAVRLRHIRGNSEMPRIAEDNRFDPRYQPDRLLNGEVTVFPGDQLLTECEYDTRNRQMLTFGGYSMMEEMCLSFVTYYPRTSLSSCHSMPPVKHLFKALGIKSFYEANLDKIEKFILRTGPMPKVNKTVPATLMPHYDDDARAIAALRNMPDFVQEDSDSEREFLLNLIVKEPAEFSNRTLNSHLHSLPWSDDLFTRSFEKSLATGLHTVFCIHRKDMLAVPLTVQSYPNFTAKPSEDLPASLCVIASSLETNGQASLCASFGFCLLFLIEHFLL